MLFRAVAVSFFWNGEMIRLIECVTISVTESLGDEQWKSYRCTNGESRCNVASVELRVGHQLISLIFFSVYVTEIGFSTRRRSHNVTELSTNPASKRPFAAIDSPCSARVLHTSTLGALWRKSIIFIYLWLMPANNIRPVLSQHSECAVSDRPIKWRIDFSFGTPRSVSQTVMQWSDRFRSWPIANKFDSVSCHDRHTHGRDCFGAAQLIQKNRNFVKLTIWNVKCSRLLTHWIQCYFHSTIQNCTGQLFHWPIQRPAINRLSFETMAQHNEYTGIVFPMRIMWPLLPSIYPNLYLKINSKRTQHVNAFQ